MSAKDLKRRLSAIMITDVKDFARLMRDDETATVRTLNVYTGVMEGLTGQYYGRVVDSPGDNMLVEFMSALNAVQCAVAVQNELKYRNDELPCHRRMAFRIGINLGDVLVDGDRIYGDGVNITARLKDLAESGGICISRAIHDQVEDKLTFAYQYLGQKTLKNINKPVSVFKVLKERRKISQGSVFEHHDRLLGQDFMSGFFEKWSRRSGSMKLLNLLPDR